MSKLVCAFICLVAGGGPGVAETAEAAAGFDWYKTQFGTGGLGNCGPACAAMAIYWATGQDISVRRIRAEIGATGGGRATNLAQQKQAIDDHEVSCVYTELAAIQGLRDIIDRGNIAVLYIHTAPLSRTPGNVTRTRVGRYYADECGHYIVVKGYTVDERYFICHDPIPGDWATNTVRYPDGSMLGRNRYYSAADVWAALRSRRVVEVSRSAFE